MQNPPSITTRISRLMVLVFTDLENSTALKERIGVDTYSKMLRRHDALLAQALIAVPGGRILQDTGDGYFIVFESPRRAVRAALLFQWLMLHEHWPEPFTTRIGLHLGEVDQSKNEANGQPKFIGSAIDLASRVMSLAKGGQVLLTRAVFEPARQEVREHPPLPDGTAAPLLRWIAHGPYRFKGSAEAMDIFEVGAEGLAPLAPPPDSEKAKRATAPAAPRVTRRRVLIGVCAALLLLGGGGFGWWKLLHRSDPMSEMRQREIEREVAASLAEQPLNFREQLPGASMVDEIKTSENEAFEILSDDRTVDMRGWKEVPADRFSQYISAVSTIRRIRIKKIAAADQFGMEFRTSGLEVFPRCLDARPFTVEVLRSEQYVGTERMKVRKLSVNVADVPIGGEFQLRTASTAWNSCQTEQEQWFGLIGYKKSFKVSMLILFPPDRPFKSYNFAVAQTAKAAPTEYDGPRMALAGPAKNWVYWEVPDPKAGSVYRLHWKW